MTLNRKIQYKQNYVQLDNPIKTSRQAFFNRLSTFKLLSPAIGVSENAEPNLRQLTSESFCKGIRAVTSDFGLGRSRGSDCKHRDARRTNSVPSSSENCPSKHESVRL